MQIDKGSAIPPYLQIANHYRREILTDALTAGAPMPTTRRLAEELDTSFSTVSRAFRILTNEGLLVARSGMGPVVADRTAVGVDRLNGQMGPGQTRVANDPYRIASRDLPDWVQHLLGTDDADRVIVRSRSIYEGTAQTPESCVQHSVSWVHPRVADVLPEIDTEGEMEPSYQRVYAQRTGQTVERRFTGHTARNATPKDIESFGMGGAVPVARNAYEDTYGVIGVGEVYHRPGTILPVQ